jgi:hypothetical protein
MKDFDLNKRKDYLDTSKFRTQIIIRFDCKKHMEKRVFEKLEMMCLMNKIPLHKMAKEMVCHVVENELDKEENDQKN